MKTMKNKVITLKPGTILCWKDYNIFKTVCSKITGRHLGYNRFKVLLSPIDLITFGSYESYAYEPLRAYSQKELTKLVNLVDANDGVSSFAEVKAIIDAIRPRTFKNALTLDDCKYYRKLDLNADAVEYIYEIEQRV